MSSGGVVWRSTTILCVSRGGKVVMIGDGQVTMGSQVVKPNARKVRRLGRDGCVIAGFAGSTADAMSLFERLESRLEERPGQLLRCCVELAQSIRGEKHYREATMLVADASVALTLTGQGDVVEPHDGLMAVGSGGPFALAAAKALARADNNMEAEELARRAMSVAAEMCVYTNDTWTIETIETKKD